MAEIQKSIEAADRSSKEKAENILKSISDSYRDKVIAALTNAKDMEAKARRAGNTLEAERYRIAVEIYQSLFDSLLK